MHVLMQTETELLLTHQIMYENWQEQLQEPHEEQGAQQAVEVKLQAAVRLGHVAQAHQSDAAV